MTPVDILRDGISEVLVTTWDNDKINSAMIGIKSDGRQLQAKVFSSSHTLDLALAGRRLVANIVDDPIIVVNATFSDLDHRYYEFRELPDDRSKTIPIIRGAAAYIYMEVSDVQAGEPVTLELKPVGWEVFRKNTIRINRGFNQVIEACVDGSRYVLNKDPDLLKRIVHACNVIKVCGGAREIEAAKLLLTFIPE